MGKASKKVIRPARARKSARKTSPRNTVHHLEARGIATSSAHLGRPQLSPVHPLSAAPIATLPAAVGAEPDVLPKMKVSGSGNTDSTRLERAKRKVKDPKRSWRFIDHLELLDRLFPNGRPNLKMNEIHDKTGSNSPSMTSRAAAFLWDTDE
jgi:hypothetical protein